MDSFTLTLNKAQLDVVIGGLGELPLKVSGPVMQAIAAQLQKAQAATLKSVPPVSPPPAAESETETD